MKQTERSLVRCEIERQIIRRFENVTGGHNRVGEIIDVRVNPIADIEDYIDYPVYWQINSKTHPSVVFLP